MTGDVALDAFMPGADLPTPGELLGAQTLGGSARDLIEALLARDIDRAQALLARDATLARAQAGERGMIEIAVATNDAAMVELLIAKGAPLDGDGAGGPLVLALHARRPELAFMLLSAGANPTPPSDPLAAFHAAIALSSEGGVTMLLDFDADPNVAGSLDRRPLHIALDMEQFRIAELLIARGADLWAIDAGGANLGTAVTTAMVTADANERAAQARLSTMALNAGWPDPVPTPQALVALAGEGRWPPRRWGHNPL